MLTIKENADNQKKESFKCKALPWQFSNSTEVSYPISYLTTTDSNSIAWDLCSTASPKCSHQSWISRNKYTRDVMNLTEKNELTQVIFKITDWNWVRPSCEIRLVAFFQHLESESRTMWKCLPRIWTVQHSARIWATLLETCVEWLKHMPNSNIWFDMQSISSFSKPRSYQAWNNTKFP